MSLSDRFAEGVEKGRVSRPAGGYIGQNSYVKLSTDIKIEQSMKNKETDFQKKKKEEDDDEAVGVHFKDEPKAK